MSLHSRLPERVQSIFGDASESEDCGCEPTFDAETLLVDASACDGEGRLADSPACRETVVDALTSRDADAVRTESGGVVRAYENQQAALLVAAGRFVEAIQFHDERLAQRARRDPLAAAREAIGRADAARDVAAETGLAELAADADGYETALAPAVGPRVSHWRVRTTPPPGAKLREVRELESGATDRR